MLLSTVNIVQGMSVTMCTRIQFTQRFVTIFFFPTGIQKAVNELSPFTHINALKHTSVKFKWHVNFPSCSYLPWFEYRFSWAQNIYIYIYIKLCSLWVHIHELIDCWFRTSEFFDLIASILYDWMLSKVFCLIDSSRLSHEFNRILTPNIRKMSTYSRY